MGRASTMMRKLRDVHLWYTSPNSLEGSYHLRCASLDFFAFKLIYLFTCISLIVICAQIIRFIRKSDVWKKLHPKRQRRKQGTSETEVAI